MLTKEQVLTAVKEGERKPGLLDNRNFGRLTSFFPVEEWKHFGFELKEDAEAPEPRPWTEEEVLKQLAGDLNFAFEKALGKRGISAGLMYHVILMWMWVLEDDLQHQEDDAYAQYGLPLLKLVAVKYNLPKPIGEHTGNEADLFSEDAPYFKEGT